MATTRIGRGAFDGDLRALVDGLRAGEAGAKAIFFERYVKLVERIVTSVLGFDAELADVLQEVFAAALASIHNLKEPAALNAWLSRVAACTARKVLRGRKRRSWLRAFVDATEEERHEPLGNPLDVEGRRALRAVYAVLDELTADERIAFALRFIDAMELEEVADVCGVSCSTIKRRLERAERRFFAHARRHPELAARVPLLSPRRAPS
ncbi:MAG TPA: sigma-70 family RNA polymerase sigma factor [Polyangiaceae bacterium]|nr:sigma-70 family RNA polymerase sigma factor [Polyangiaceae bacterium]